MTSISRTKLSICTCCILASMSLPAQGSPPRPEPLPITEQRNAAVGYALSYASVVVNVTNTCKMVPALSRSPIDAFTSWHSRNGQIFEAAKSWVGYVTSNIKASRGQASADEFRNKVIGEAARTGETTVKGFFSKDPQSVVCEKWIGLLFSPQSDFVNSRSEFNKDLQDILQFTKAVAEWNPGR